MSDLRSAVERPVVDAEPWPFEKIARNLGSPARGRRCVLLTTGALNPVHLGHVAMFDRAKSCLENEFGLEVVDGFLSPSSDRYLLAKYRDPSNFFPAGLRLQLCAAATRDHSFLAVASWESSVLDRWPDFPEVTENLAQALHRHFPRETLVVLYVCGEDHFHLARAANLPGICVVSRAGRSGKTDEASNVFAVTTAMDDEISLMSATRVRSALKTRDRATLEADLHPDVMAMLLGRP